MKPEQRKIKVGLVQINNSFSGQNYFPYSLGFLQAYAQKNLENVNRFEFGIPVYKKVPVEEAVEKLSYSDLAFFSTYVWNFKLSSEIARRLKQEKPETLIVFGGCQVPKMGREDFMNKLSFLDIACYGEGERTFKSILENYQNRDWKNISSISYLNENKNIITNPAGERIRDLTEIPSPYLDGTFDSLIKENPGETWLGLWETNRGCPYGCAYCEWGGEYHKKLVNHDLEKLLKEIDWFSQNKIEFIFCCDSNFGIQERDFEIAKKVAENKRKYGFPKALSVQNTKNSSLRTYEIQKVLSDSGLSKGVNLAFQSLNEKTLHAIGRKNISNKVFYELQQRFNKECIETFSDIILGLPEETYQTFVKGIESLIEGGQKNRIQFNNLSLLPNSEMNNPKYQRKYGIQFIENELINIHGSLEEGEILERQKLVIGTNSMPPEEWVKTRAFGWMISYLYFDKMLQIPMTLLKKEYSIKYSDITESFLEIDQSKSPLIGEISSFFINKAKAIQKGDSEFCESKKWLNIWWPADELMLIKTCAENNLEIFYEEASRKIEEMLMQRNIKNIDEILEESIILNKNLIKLPFQNQDKVLPLSFNLLEFYKGHMTRQPVDISRGDFKYLIDRTSETWDSWEDWCKKVVWYGNKRGSYMYNCKSLQV